jgi:undecaprenyl-diphosphatase
MIASIADRILGLHGWAAVAVVFALPALESSAFVGFVFPGEIGVLLGGVLAYQHKVSLPAVLVAGIAGAIVGDSVGYEVGKRWGRQLLHGTVGRVVKAHHLERAERYLATRGGKAVFFGRFTAALRVLIPGLAGMSGLEYRTFLAYNAAGGTLWAGAFVVAGYAAGGSWRQVEHVAGRASIVLLLLGALFVGVVFAARWVGRNQPRWSSFAARQLDRSPVVRWRSRYRRQLGFLARRLRPEGALGLSLTASFAAVVAAGWALSVVVQDVVAGDDAVRLDRPTLEWFARHRGPWLTTAMKTVTTLGSSALLIPLVLSIGGLWWWRRRTPRPLTLLVGAYGGSNLLFHAIKVLADRPRPPASLAIERLGGLSFPSGHATQAIAVYGMLAALVAASTPSWPRKVAAWAVAVFVAAVVGISRLYLGSHWLTDVLGGLALGALWLALVLGAARTIAGLRSPSAPRPTATPGVPA